MQTFLLLFFLMSVGMTQQACSSSDPHEPEMPETPSDETIFDDFQTFDATKWTKESHPAGWVNQELQIYDADHVSVGRDGDKTVLVITAERKGGKIYSGRVNSQGKKAFRHGRIEASIRLPKTNGGLWPAFWMMGNNDKPWPQCGEIDILEMGEKSGMSQGTPERTVNTAIHYGTNANDGHLQEYHIGQVARSLQDDQYHTYTLDWDDESLVISIDGVRFHRFDISQKSGRHAYFHDHFYLLFNLAVGGSFTGITDISRLTALKEGEKVRMYVDWVKYQPLS